MVNVVVGAPPGARWRQRNSFLCLFGFFLAILILVGGICCNTITKIINEIVCGAVLPHLLNYRKK